jgi:hypothetical protein
MTGRNSKGLSSRYGHLWEASSEDEEPTSQNTELSEVILSNMSTVLSSMSIEERTENNSKKRPREEFDVQPHPKKKRMEKHREPEKDPKKGSRDEQLNSKKRHREEHSQQPSKKQRGENYQPHDEQLNSKKRHWEEHSQQPSKKQRGKNYQPHDQQLNSKKRHWEEHSQQPSKKQRGKNYQPHDEQLDSKKIRAEEVELSDESSCDSDGGMRLDESEGSAGLLTEDESDSSLDAGAGSPQDFSRPADIRDLGLEEESDGSESFSWNPVSGRYTGGHGPVAYKSDTDPEAGSRPLSSRRKGHHRKEKSPADIERDRYEAKAMNDRNVYYKVKADKLHIDLNMMESVLDDWRLEDNLTAANCFETQDIDNFLRSAMDFGEWFKQAKKKMG